MKIKVSRIKLKNVKNSPQFSRTNSIKNFQHISFINKYNPNILEHYKLDSSPGNQELLHSISPKKNILEIAQNNIQLNIPKYSLLKNISKDGLLKVLDFLSNNCLILINKKFKDFQLSEFKIEENNNQEKSFYLKLFTEDDTLSRYTQSMNDKYNNLISKTDYNESNYEDNFLPEKNYYNARKKPTNFTDRNNKSTFQNIDSEKIIKKRSCFYKDGNMRKNDSLQNLSIPLVPSLSHKIFNFPSQSFIYRIKCPECELKFTDIGSLERHKSEIHQDKVGDLINEQIEENISQSQIFDVKNQEKLKKKEEIRLKNKLINLEKERKQEERRKLKENKIKDKVKKIEIPSKHEGLKKIKEINIIEEIKKLNVSKDLLSEEKGNNSKTKTLYQRIYNPKLGNNK